jgi:hypothetical protein
MSQNPRRARQVAQSILKDSNTDGTRTSEGWTDRGTLPEYTVLSLFLRHRVVKVSHGRHQPYGLSAGRTTLTLLASEAPPNPGDQESRGPRISEGDTPRPPYGATSWRCYPGLSRSVAKLADSPVVIFIR